MFRNEQEAQEIKQELRQLAFGCLFYVTVIGVPFLLMTLVGRFGWLSMGKFVLVSFVVVALFGLLLRAEAKLLAWDYTVASLVTHRVDWTKVLPDEGEEDARQGEGYPVDGILGGPNEAATEADEGSRSQGAVGSAHLWGQGDG